eukprot:UN31093
MEEKWILHGIELIMHIMNDEKLRLCMYPYPDTRGFRNFCHHEDRDTYPRPKSWAKLKNALHKFEIINNRVPPPDRYSYYQDEPFAIAYLALQIAPWPEHDVDVQFLKEPRIPPLHKGLVEKLMVHPKLEFLNAPSLAHAENLSWELRDNKITWMPNFRAATENRNFNAKDLYPINYDARHGDAEYIDQRSMVLYVPKFQPEGNSPDIFEKLWVFSKPLAEEQAKHTKETFAGYFTLMSSI